MKKLLVFLLSMVSVPLCAMWLLSVPANGVRVSRWYPNLIRVCGFNENVQLYTLQPNGKWLKREYGRGKIISEVELTDEERDLDLEPTFEKMFASEEVRKEIKEDFLAPRELYESEERASKEAREKIERELLTQAE